MSRLRIGELLVQQGLLSQERLEKALDYQRSQGTGARRLGQVLIDLGFVNEVQLTKVLSQHLSVPWVSLHHIDFSRLLLNLVPKQIAEEFCVIPVYVRNERKTGETLYLAMEDPTHDDAIRAVMNASGLPVKSMIAAASDIRGAIRAFYGGAPSEPAMHAVRPPTSSTPPAEPIPLVRSNAPPSPPKAPPVTPPTAAPIAAPVSAAAPATPSAVSEPPKPVESPPAAAPVTAAPSPEAPTPAVGVPRLRKPTRPPVETTPAKRAGPRMIALTLLDGTTIQIPAQRKRGGEAPAPEPEPTGPEDKLTTRDLIVALRAVAAGANREETLGDASWETIVAALLAVLLKKQLIADWEFVEEWQKL